MGKRYSSRNLNQPLIAVFFGASGGLEPTFALIYLHLFSLNVAYQHLAASRISKEMQTDATKGTESSI